MKIQIHQIVLQEKDGKPVSLDEKEKEVADDVTEE